MQRRSLNDSERRDWLRLTCTENVGAITFRHLLQRYGSAAAALEAIPDLAARGGKRAFKLPGASAIDNEIKASEKISVRFIASIEPDYPEALAAIKDAPAVTAVRGQIWLLHKRAIGIVGARNASLSGR
jgi:DNA processing protein